MGKNFYIITAITVVVILGVLSFIFKNEFSKDDIKRTVPVIATLSDNEFTLKADHYDSMGIYPGTSFSLFTKNNVEKSSIEGNLLVEPEFKYKIESSDNNEFTIVPEETLKDNTIYKFSIVAQQEGNESVKEYQWAYQTKSTFKVMGSLPADQTNYVPTDTGIEINFSHENYLNYEDYFSINPEVDGTFEKHRKTLVFIPDSLANGTLYTVTMKKGLPLNGSDLILDTDYVFQFETESTSEKNGRVSFSDTFFEYPTGQVPILTINEHDTGLTSLNIELYAFSSFKNFTSAVDTLNNFPYWAYYSKNNNIYPTDNLELVSNFDVEINDQDYTKYVEFPESLNAGYYLVQIYNSDGVTQAYLQIGDLIASYQGTTDNSFIWTHDLNTSLPLDGATLRFSHDSDFSAITNSKGLAEFSTPIQIASEKKNKKTNIFYYTIEYEGSQLLIPVEHHYEMGGWMMSGASKDYWTYLYTNRTLYSPTDSIKYWGVLKNRDGNQVPQVKVQLVKSRSYYTGAEESIIQEFDINIGEYGTYEGYFDYINLDSGWYTLRMLVGDVQVASRSIEVATYTKPAYKIEVNTDKKAYFEGEDITYNIKTVYYDGTPLGNLELEYNGTLGNGKITTDVNGEANLVLASSYTDNTYYPSSPYLSIHPTQTEMAEIYTYVNVYMFGPSMDLEAKMDEDDKISGNVYEVDLTTINDEGSDYAWNYEGAVVPGVNVEATIYHEYYNKTETGTRYDFINKKTYITYDYNFQSDVVDTKQVTSDSEGKFLFNYNYQEGKKYKVEFIITDGAGRTAKTQVYKYSGSFGYNYYGAQGFDYYSITDGDGGVYQPGETVDISFYKNEDLLSETTNNDFIYFKGMTNIFDIISSNKSNYTFDFKDSYAPNIYVYGIYFDGRSYHLTESLRLNYDTSIKKLSIDIDLDQENYKPGEKVKMDITVTDIDNNPVKAEVNISAIDEALTAIQWKNSASFLTSLYVKLPRTLEYSYQSHKNLMAPKAEGGGCFTGDTKILMSDGNYKKISDVRIGESILTRASEDSNSLVAAKVLNTVEHLVTGYLIINKNLEVTDEHVIYLNGEWQTAGEAKIGDILLDSSGGEVVIETIDKIRKPSMVFNLHIEKLNTFMADDIYVHNNKGDARQDFHDIAFFGSVETNSQGKASISFDLPDNVTSWQTTVHALTKDLKAENTTTAVIATLPFFVDVAVAKDYVVGDRPVIKVRSFGVELNTNSQVDYTITYPGYNEDEINVISNANEPVELALPEFGAGEFSIRVDAKQGSNEDAVIKSFDFHESNILESNSTLYTLNEGMDITGSEDGYTSVTFTNKERGQYYNFLKRAKWNYGDRVEQKISRYYAEKYLMQFFDEAVSSDNDFDFSLFQQGDGGISLLPYSSSDILLTAKIMEIANDKFDNLSAKDYFEGILVNTNSNIDEIVYALFGMANLGEPVLTHINLLIENNEISPQLMIYLARSLSNLGATEYATTLLQTILDQYGDETDNYIRLVLGKDQDEYTEYTYQAAIILAQASSDKANKLFNYAYANPAVEQLNNLERLAYVKYALPLLSGAPVSFSYVLDGKTTDVSLLNNEKLTLMLTSNQLDGITFSNIVGAVGLVSSYQIPLKLLDVNVDPDISVSREYTVEGVPTVNFQENDIVKITLSPNISNEAIDNSYQLTDYLPSGLRLLTSLQAWEVDWEKPLRYPFEVNGQAIKFWTNKTTKPFHYYAVVNSKGDYKAEPTTLQGFVAKDSFNYGVQSTINIQ